MSLAFTAPRVGTRDGLHGTWLLMRLAWRTNRWFYLAWVFALWSVMPAAASKYNTIMLPGAAAETAVALSQNVTMRALLGPPYDLLHVGPFVMWRVGTFVAAGAALMAVLGVIRVTRAEEEAGRAELLRAGVIGRWAPLTAGLLVALGACATLGALIAVTMAASAPPVSSAVATGGGIALVGAVWAAIAAVAAQLTASARMARAIAGGTLAVAYLVRAIGDGASADSIWRAGQWLSPVEWAALTRPYAGERWWVWAMLAGLTVLLVMVAAALHNRRDLGAGFRPPLPGPAHASPGLRSVPTLALRLLRGAMLGWLVGMLTGSWVIGTLVPGITEMVRTNPQLAEMFQQMGTGPTALQDAFFVAMLGVMAPIAAGCAVGLLIRLHTEEQTRRAELVLAMAPSRQRLALSYLVPAFLVPAAALWGTGAAMALPTTLQDRDAAVVLSTAMAALVLVPGVWLIAALLMLLIGWLPRLVPTIWLVLGWSVFVMWLGELLDLPAWMQHCTTWAALPQMPADPLSWTPVLLETGLALALTLLGLAGFRRRDIG